MENAHLRLGLLEYVRITEKISTRIRLRVDRYIGEDRQAHLLSVFGNDSDVGAITAAVHEKAAFSLTFPDGATKDVTLGDGDRQFASLLGPQESTRHRHPPHSPERKLLRREAPQMPPARIYPGGPPATARLWYVSASARPTLLHMEAQTNQGLAGSVQVADISFEREPQD
jgi:hypothetical protein